VKPRVESSGGTGAGPGWPTDDRRGLMPDALRIGLLGPLQVRDGAGNRVPIGGRQLRLLLVLLALDAGRVVPAGSLAGQLWPDEPPGNPATRSRPWSPGCGASCAGPGSAR
jgi:hypothetical protein